MKYEGKVYAKINGRYIECTQTIEDLEKTISYLKDKCEDHESHISEFANWLTHNNWFSFENGKWRYTFEHGTCISDESYEENYTKTWSELYAIYKKEKK